MDPESGKAAGLSRSKLKLSKWAEGYEREQGKIRCPERERNNKRREAGERVVDGRGHSGGRWRRERMSPQREPREVIPAEREGPERERVAWQRAEERTQWERLQRWREKELGGLERRSKREWSELYGRQERQREQLAKDCRGMLGRFRAWRELGGKLREIGGTIRGRTEVLGRFREELEHRLRWEPVSLGKAHSEAVRGIESKAGESLSQRHYEKMRRAMEKASQAEKALQMERASQPVRTSQFPSRKRPGAPWAGTRGTGAGLWPQPLILGGVSSEECGPNATRGLAELARLDGVNAGGFRHGLQDAPEVPQCGGGPDVARADEGGMRQHRFKGTAFAYGSQSW